MRYISQLTTLLCLIAFSAQGTNIDGLAIISDSETITENDGSFEIVVTRSRNTDTELTGILTIEPPEAYDPLLFQDTEETVTFAPGETEIRRTILILNNDFLDLGLGMSQRFRVEFQQIEPVVRFPFWKDFVVEDDESGIGFNASAGRTTNGHFQQLLDVDEGDDIIQIEVARLGDISIPYDFDLRYVPLTAVEGEDFEVLATSGTVPAGEETATIPFKILQDGVTDGGKALTIHLENIRPTGLSSAPELLLTIHDEDALGLPGTLLGPPVTTNSGCDLSDIVQVATHTDDWLLVSSRCEESGFLYRKKLDGTIDPDFALEIPARIENFWIDPEGRIYVAADFPYPDEWPNRYLTRLLPDGRFDPSWQLSFDRTVTDMEFEEDGSVYVCGNFRGVNGETTGSFVRINPDGSLDASFPDLPYTRDLFSISSIEDGAWLASYVDLLRFGAEGAKSVIWNVSSSTRLLDLHAGAIALQHPRPTKLMRDGGVDTTFDATAIGPRDDILATTTDGRLIISTQGEVTVLDNTSRPSLMRLFEDGTVDPTFTFEINEAAASTSPPDVWALANGNLAIRGLLIDKVSGQSVGNTVILRGNDERSRTRVHWNASRVGTPEHGTLELIAIREGDSNTSFTATCRSVSGSALAGTDFATIETILEFQPGEMMKVVSIDILEDDELEGIETFSVEILPADTEVDLGQNPVIEVSILEDEYTYEIIDGPVRSFEEGGNAELLVRRIGSHAYETTINWSLEVETAEGSGVFDATERSNIFPPVEDTISLPLSTDDNLFPDGLRKATVRVNGELVHEFEILDHDLQNFSADVAVGEFVDLVADLQGGVYAAGFIQNIHGTKTKNVVRLDSAGRLDPDFDFPNGWQAYWHQRIGYSSSPNFPRYGQMFVRKDGALLLAVHKEHRRDGAVLILDETGQHMEGSPIELEGNAAYLAPVDQDTIFVGTGSNNSLYTVPSTSSIELINASGSIDESFVNPVDFGPFASSSEISFHEDKSIVTLANFSAGRGHNWQTISHSGDKTQHPGSAVVSDLASGFRYTVFNSDTSVKIDRFLQPEHEDGSTGTIVRVISAQNDSLYMLGNFTRFNGESHDKLVRLFPDGTVDSTFISEVGAMLPEDLNPVVLASSRDDALYIATSNLLFRVTADGSLDKEFGVHSFTGSNRVLPVIEETTLGTVFFAADMWEFDGEPRFGLARIHPDGTLGTSDPIEITSLHVDDPETISMNIDSRFAGTGELQRLNTSLTWETVEAFDIQLGYRTYEFAGTRAGRESDILRVVVTTADP